MIADELLFLFGPNFHLDLNQIIKSVECGLRYYDVVFSLLCLYPQRILEVTENSWFV